MAEIVGIRFKKVGKVYYFNPCGLQTQVGQNVIVETARGVEYGEVALANRVIEDEEVVKPLKKIIRIATAADAKVVETNQKRADEAFLICEQKIADHHLDMKLVSVEYTFDLNKILFYFTADGRVDFRDLVKDLASVFRTRIELRQIGVRDEAKVLGGLGICGRPLCCSSFLDDFQPVSINMAKEQNLSLNPTKISGTCGRLMCCLKYEHEVYSELSKITPRPDSVVETPLGTGVVIDSSILRGTCAVRLDGEMDELHTFRCTECQIIHSARKGRRSNNVATRAAAVAALSNTNTRPQNPDPLPELSESLSATSIPMHLEPVSTPPQADAPSRDKPPRRRSKKRSDGESHTGGERERKDAERTKRPHKERAKRPERGERKERPPKQNAPDTPKEHRDGDNKPRRRRRPRRHSGHHDKPQGAGESNS